MRSLFNSPDTVLRAITGTRMINTYPRFRNREITKYTNHALII